MDGLVAGFVVAAVFARRGNGEPSITIQTADYAIWFAVLSVIGALNSLVLYFLNALVACRLDNG